MNKYFTLLLAGIAIQTGAADVGFGAAMSVNASTSAGEKEMVGVTATAEYEAALTEKSAAFASANIFVSPLSFQAGGPKNANFVVGGTFSQQGSPASAQICLGLEVISPAAAESSIIVAPAIFSGAKFAINDDYALTTKVMHTIPVSKKGEIESSMTTASFGIQKTIAIEV